MKVKVNYRIFEKLKDKDNEAVEEKETVTAEKE